ncbi:hypothetical protein YC2023_068485 [Brassica napus]
MSEKPQRGDVVADSTMRSCSHSSKALSQRSLLKKLRVALDLWHQFLKTGQKPDVTMHNILIHGLCSVGKLDDAMKLAAEMERWSCVANLVTYNTLMEGCFKVRDSNIATVIWGYMYKKGWGADVVSYNIMLSGLCMCGRVRHAIEFFDDARSHGIAPTPTVVAWDRGESRETKRFIKKKKEGGEKKSLKVS